MSKSQRPPNDLQTRPTLNAGAGDRSADAFDAPWAEYGNFAFAGDMLAQAPVLSAPAPQRAPPTTEGVMQQMQRGVRGVSDKATAWKGMRDYVGLDGYDTGDWCGALGAKTYIDALTSTFDKKKAATEKRSLIKQFGSHVASDIKIKEHFYRKRDITVDGRTALTAQYRSWDPDDQKFLDYATKSGEKKLPKDKKMAAEDAAGPIQFTGDAQKDVRMFGVGDAMLIDGAYIPTPQAWGDKEAEKAERDSSGYKPNRSNHIAWVKGVTADEKKNKNLAYIHTVEGNTTGKADGKAQYGQVEHTYLMLPRKGQGQDKDKVVGYDTLRALATVDTVDAEGKKGKRTLDIQELVDIGMEKEDLPEEELARLTEEEQRARGDRLKLKKMLNLSFDENSTPEVIKAGLTGLKSRPPKGVSMNYLGTVRIDGQLDVEQVPDAAGTMDQMPGAADGKAAAGPVAAPTVATPVFTSTAPATLQAENEQAPEDSWWSRILDEPESEIA